NRLTEDVVLARWRPHDRVRRQCERRERGNPIWPTMPISIQDHEARPIQVNPRYRIGELAPPPRDDNRVSAHPVASTDQRTLAPLRTIPEHGDRKGGDAYLG